jgi:hypothetical protein
MYTFIDFISQIIGRRGPLVLQTRGSHTLIWCRMGCHVAQGMPHNPHAIQAINMVGRHPKPHSWMEDGLKCTQRMEGQLPRTGLMAPSMCHGRGMTTGTGGGCAVISASRIILQVGHGMFHLFLCCIGAPLCSAIRLCAPSFSVFSGLLGSVMPRERGKPKRGPSWYCYVARQRRLRELERASSTTLIQRTKEPKTPPMAYVEEEIPEEPILVPPDSLLYMVPDPQDRPNTSLTTMDTEATMEGATCIVQEEIPWMDRPTEPPLPTSDTGRDPSSPNFLTLEHLELIFEMRRYMMEQLHRHTLLSSRIDMLFDAFSSTSVKQRCLTCVQPFSFTPHDDTPDDSSDGRFHCSNSPSNV